MKLRLAEKTPKDQEALAVMHKMRRSLLLSTNTQQMQLWIIVKVDLC